MDNLEKIFPREERREDAAFRIIPAVFVGDAKIQVAPGGGKRFLMRTMTEKRRREGGRRERKGLARNSKRKTRSATKLLAENSGARLFAR